MAACWYREESDRERPRSASFTVASCDGAFRLPPLPASRSPRSAMSRRISPPPNQRAGAGPLIARNSGRRRPELFENEPRGSTVPRFDARKAGTVPPLTRSAAPARFSKPSSRVVAAIAGIRQRAPGGPLVKPEHPPPGPPASPSTSARPPTLTAADDHGDGPATGRSASGIGSVTRTGALIAKWSGKGSRNAGAGFGAAGIVYKLFTRAW